VIGKVLGIFQDSLTGSAEPKDDLWYWALLKTLRADMRAEKLYPPGRNYWINSPASDHDAPDSSSKAPLVQLHEVDDVETAFNEVTFSTTMFTDHSPHHYEGSLELLWSAMQ
jgi:hypothetical protein